MENIVTSVERKRTFLEYVGLAIERAEKGNSFSQESLERMSTIQSNLGLSHDKLMEEAEKYLGKTVSE